MIHPRSRYAGQPLLAKSFKEGFPETSAPKSATLLGHLTDVRNVATEVLSASGDRVLADLGLSYDPWLPRLRRALLLAASLHDLGKANDRFQAMLRGDRHLGKQPVRHEALSVFLALRPDLLRPLVFPSQDLGEDLPGVAAVLAVLGHHVKYWPRHGQPPGVAVPGAAGPIRLLCGHSDFADCAEAVTGQRPSLLDVSLLPSEILSFGDRGEGLSSLLVDLEDEVGPAFGHIPSDPTACLQNPWGRLLAATKALLVGCDVAGSAVPLRDTDPAVWAARALKERLSPEQLGSLIVQRLALGPEEAPSDHLRPFQGEVAASSRRITVAEAGCGSGKTVAAYAWGQKRAAGRKLFLCYPTTGTATEGFGDYVLDTSIPGELVHSRAIVDLEGLLTNAGRPGPDSDEDDDVALRIAGLKPWGARIVVCTADTVLGLLQNHRRGLFSSPAMLGSAMVFDEVHSYDDSMWETLIRLLQLLPGAPVLLMTATLPEGRRRVLEKTFGEEVAFVQGPERLERLPRYEVRSGWEEEVALRRVVREVEAGRRVLWVSNTVDRAVRRARSVAETLGVEAGKGPVYVYHSRFRYEDRAKRHREMVDRFKRAEAAPEGLLASTTQVAEMSLDLDAEILVTDLAPIPSLIQRMGRLNRRAVTEEECKPKACVVLPVDAALPYGVESLEAARSWLGRLSPPTSQRDLANAFLQEQENREPSSPRRPNRPALLELVQAGPGQLREPGYTVSFLLPEDAARAREDRTHAIRAALPLAPGRRPFGSWERIGHAFVLPEETVAYDERVGGRWLAREEAAS